MRKLAPPFLVLAFAVSACAPEPSTVIVMGTGVATPLPPPPPVTAARRPKPMPALAPEPPAVTPKPDSPPLDIIVRDRRFNALSPRARPLLITEIQGLESIARVALSSERPRHLRRLADRYAEFAVSASRAYPASVHSVRLKAIQSYEDLMLQYPQWCAMPNGANPSKSAGCADEALYYLGLEAERDADLVKARRAYADIIQQWPTSRLVPSAHLGFAEMFLAESAADTAKLRRAEQSYLDVLRYPPPDNELYGYALLQLGQVYTRLNDRLRANDALNKAIAWSSAYPAAPGARAVAEAARAALIP